MTWTTYYYVTLEKYFSNKKKGAVLACSPQSQLSSGLQCTGVDFVLVYGLQYLLSSFPILSSSFLYKVVISYGIKIKMKWICFWTERKIYWSGCSRGVINLKLFPLAACSSLGLLVAWKRLCDLGFFSRDSSVIYGQNKRQGLKLKAKCVALCTQKT